MNILFCKNSFAGPISGADEIVVNYAIELRDAGHQTSVLLVHPPTAANPQAARLKQAGIPISSLASNGFSSTLAAARRIAIGLMHTFSPLSRLIRSNSRKIVFELLERYHDACCEYLARARPDVVHVMTPDPGAVMLIRAAHAVGIPVVYQEVGIPFDPPGFEEVYERFATVLPLCTEIAALSPRLAEEMSRVLPHLNQPLVLPLISPQCARIAEGAEEPARDGTLCFGFAARLEHLKGPIRFVEGYHIARRTQPAVRFKMAGEGSQQHEIVAMIDCLKLERAEAQMVGVYTTERERDLFMQSIDVFVLPSLTEGTPNAIIEAMSHGKAVIATDVGGIADIVTPDVGILVSSDDTGALGAAMARLAGDRQLCDRMGRAAQKKYERLFTPRAVLPLLVAFYERTLESHQLASDNECVRHQPAQAIHPWSFVSQPGEVSVMAD